MFLKENKRQHVCVCERERERERDTEGGREGERGGRERKGEANSISSLIEKSAVLSIILLKQK